MQALLKEIDYYLNLSHFGLKQRKITSVYFGGGTPSGFERLNNSKVAYANNNQKGLASVRKIIQASNCSWALKLHFLAFNGRAYINSA